ncbi:7508_t:CDS:2 [Dentiscutata erythropus]|uniref:7508_t:CDS:1 n=1 Tax=Dentiscutata erythropus TaxID=1348616 RepID=A0A9N9JMQ4_9GLOM|nr:7508_t:CDS:2 [Dentiscutata erythropus]
MEENSKREADHTKLKEDTTSLKTKNTELKAEALPHQNPDLSLDNNTSNLSCGSKTASLERDEQIHVILAESEFLETEISKLEQDNSTINDNPSRNQAQSIISSEINIMTKHQPKDTFTSNKVECVPCDLGSHPYVTKSSNSNNLAESKSLPEIWVSTPPSPQIPKISNAPMLLPFKKMLSKEKHKEVINKLTIHFTNSPKLDLYFSIDKEGKWWLDNQGKKIYYLHCTNLKEPGISLDDVLEAYPENSKLIQELKTQCYTLPIP